MPEPEPIVVAEEKTAHESVEPNQSFIADIAELPANGEPAPLETAESEETPQPNREVSVEEPQTNIEQDEVVEAQLEPESTDFIERIFIQKDDQELEYKPAQKEEHIVTEVFEALSEQAEKASEEERAEAVEQFLEVVEIVKLIKEQEEPIVTDELIEAVTVLFEKIGLEQNEEEIQKFTRALITHKDIDAILQHIAEQSEYLDEGTHEAKPVHTQLLSTVTQLLKNLSGHTYIGRFVLKLNELY